MIHRQPALSSPNSSQQDMQSVRKTVQDNSSHPHRCLQEAWAESFLSCKSSRRCRLCLCLVHSFPFSHNNTLRHRLHSHWLGLDWIESNKSQYHRVWVPRSLHHITPQGSSCIELVTMTPPNTNSRLYTDQSSQQDPHYHSIYRWDIAKGQESIKDNRTQRRIDY